MIRGESDPSGNRARVFSVALPFGLVAAGQKRCPREGPWSPKNGIPRRRSELGMWGAPAVRRSAKEWFRTRRSAERPWTNRGRATAPPRL